MRGLSHNVGVLKRSVGTERNCDNWTCNEEHTTCEGLQSEAGVETDTSLLV